MSLFDGDYRDRVEHSLIPLTRGAGRLPRTVGDCRGPGVCPLFRCRFNIAIHITESGTLVTGGRGSTAEGASIPLKRRCRGQVRYDDLDAFTSELVERIDGLESTCALDYADKGGMTLDAVGDVLGVSRERVRQIVAKASAELAQDEDIAESFVDLVGRVR